MKSGWDMNNLFKAIPGLEIKLNVKKSEKMLRYKMVEFNNVYGGHWTMSYISTLRPETSFSEL